MSIQRFIHPSIWRSEQVSALEHGARLLFIGCFSTADDEGRRKASPASLKADVFPLDESVSIAQVAIWTRHVHDMGLIRVYSGPDRVQYLDLPTWTTYQRPKYKKKSILPAYSPDLPPIWPTSGADVDRTGAESGRGLGCTGLDCVGLGGDGIANAGEAPADEAPKPARTIPKPIVTVADAFGLTPFCAKMLREGYEPQRLLAWLLLLARRKPDNPHGYLKGCISDGKVPADAYMAEALQLLRTRDAQIAAQHGAGVPSMAGLLRSEPAGESFAQKKNRTLNALKDEQEKGGGRERGQAG